MVSTLAQGRRVAKVSGLPPCSVAVAALTIVEIQTTLTLKN